MLRIYREGGSFRLIPELLGRHLRVTGLVVFTLGRIRQRGIAREVAALVHPEIEAFESETRSPNDCMCVPLRTVFHPERYSLAEVLKLASDTDWEFEKQAKHGRRLILRLISSQLFAAQFATDPRRSS